MQKFADTKPASAAQTTPERRQWLLAAAALAATAWSPAARAQAAGSSGTIRFIVPYPAGGATDILARMVSQKLAEAWKANVVVENRAGAAGTIGANAVAKAAPDGQTVLFSIVALVQQIPLMNLPYDPLKDFTPITRAAVSPSILAVPKETPANTLREFVAWVKSQPGKHSYGTYGAGTSSHIQGSLLNLQGGMDMVHVPYAGGAPLVNAMMGGQLAAAFLDAGSSRPHLPKFKLLGVTGPARLAWLPDVPTMGEQGFTGFEPRGWFGVLLPAGTPKGIVDRYASECQRILGLPEIKSKIEDMGLVPIVETPEQFAQSMQVDASVYARIIRDAGIKLN